MNILLRSVTMATVVFTPAAAHASAPLFAATPLSDAELEEARGGFTLSGLKFDIGAVISTTVDGVKVLTSQLNYNNDSITGSVQTTSNVQATVSGVGAITENISETVNQAAGEITTAVEKLVGSLGSLDQSGDTTSTAGSTVSVSNGSAPTTSTPTIVNPVVPDAVVKDVVDGGTNLADQLGSQTAGALVDAAGNVSVAVNTNVSQNPATTNPVTTTAVPAAAVVNNANQVLSDAGNATTSIPGGTPQVSAATAGTINVPVSSTTVNGSNYMNSSVQMADLLVKHSLGSSISSLVANTGSNRVIDTQLAINIRLDNVLPQSIGSIGFRVDALGIDASTWRASR